MSPEPRALVCSSVCAAALRDPWAVIQSLPKHMLAISPAAADLDWETQTQTGGRGGRGGGGGGERESSVAQANVI